MTDREQRQVGELLVQIDRGLCVGFGDCIEAAPGAFRLDNQSIAVFTAPECASREELLRACDACPVDAITVWDTEGRQLVP